jgi:hypothetical protein
MCAGLFCTYLIIVTILARDDALRNAHENNHLVRDNDLVI